MLSCVAGKAHEQSLPLAQASQAHLPSLEHTPAREQSQSEAHRNAALKFAQPGSVNHKSVSVVKSHLSASELRCLWLHYVYSMLVWQRCVSLWGVPEPQEAFGKLPTPPLTQTPRSPPCGSQP